MYQSGNSIRLDVRLKNNNYKFIYHTPIKNGSTEKNTENAVTITKGETKILEAIQANASITKAELAIQCNLSLGGVEWNIRNLKRRGILLRLGSTKKGYWQINEEPQKP